jgi:hypothetical protein
MSKLVFTLICCTLLYVSLTTALVLHRNGALVPEDTAEVLAARDLHLEALSLADGRGDEQEVLLGDEAIQERGLLRNIWRGATDCCRRGYPFMLYSLLYRCRT